MLGFYIKMLSSIPSNVESGRKQGGDQTDAGKDSGATVASPRLLECQRNIWRRFPAAAESLPAVATRWLTGWPGNLFSLLE